MLPGLEEREKRAVEDEIESKEELQDSEVEAESRYVKVEKRKKPKKRRW